MNDRGTNMKCHNSRTDPSTDPSNRLISSGQCHADWGRKRIEALQTMLEVKERRLEKKRANK